VNEEISRSLDAIAEATQRLFTTVDSLNDARVREPSRLPGWTRGHVLNHIARNADGLVNLLRWAASGTRTPMYASARAREAGIESGAGRPLAALAADVRDSAARFAGEAAKLSDGAWTVRVEGLKGGPFPARGILTRRICEVEIHHVDLGAGYSPAQWLPYFVAEALPRTAEWFSGRQDAPACRLVPREGGEQFTIGPAVPPAPPCEVRGPGAALLAWLTGRGTGEGLTVRPDGPLPALPPWR
jgi:maleylpyruvate isomerase